MDRQASVFISCHLWERFPWTDRCQYSFHVIYENVSHGQTGVSIHSMSFMRTFPMDRQASVFISCHLWDHFPWADRRQYSFHVIYETISHGQTGVSIHFMSFMRTFPMDRHASVFISCHLWECFPWTDRRQYSFHVIYENVSHGQAGVSIHFMSFMRTFPMDRQASVFISCHLWERFPWTDRRQYSFHVIYENVSHGQTGVSIHFMTFMRTFPMDRQASVFISCHLWERFPWTDRRQYSFHIIYENVSHGQTGVSIHFMSFMRTFPMDRQASVFISCHLWERFPWTDRRQYSFHVIYETISHGQTGVSIHFMSFMRTFPMDRQASVFISCHLWFTQICIQYKKMFLKVSVLRI